MRQFDNQLVAPRGAPSLGGDCDLRPLEWQHHTPRSFDTWPLEVSPECSLQSIPESIGAEGGDHLGIAAVPKSIGRSICSARENTSTSLRSGFTEKTCLTPKVEASLGDAYPEVEAEPSEAEANNQESTLSMASQYLSLATVRSSSSASIAEDCNPKVKAKRPSSGRETRIKISQYDTAHLSSQLEQLKDIRAQEQERRHRIVVVFGTMLIVIGCTVEGILAGREWLTNRDIKGGSTSQHLSWSAVVILHPFGILNLSSGLVVITINPLGDFDVNAQMSRHPRARICIMLFVALRSLLLGVAPPHFGAVAAVLAACIILHGTTRIFRFRKKRLQRKQYKKRSGILLPVASAFQMHSTTLLTSILALWALGNALNFLYIAYTSMMAEERPAIPGFHWLILSSCNIMMVIVWFGLCFSRQRRHSLHNGLDFTMLTESLYEATYGYLNLMGAFFLWAGFLPIAFHDELAIPIGLGRILSGIAYLAPLSVFLVLRRDNILPFFLEQCQASSGGSERARDGAFLAAMLDSVIFEVGQPWWVHRPSGQVDNEFPKEDHRHFWQRGVIDRVEEEKVFVQISSGGEVVEQQIASRHATSKQLLELARLNLRCIDWKELTVDVLKGELTTCRGLTIAGGDSNRARPVQNGEIIDFFVSHSWYDDAAIKYSQLEMVANDFILAEGREPTFWLDHVCIDQANILDGLKVLPVNILVCRRFIALCGRTYLTRLWCAWELCTSLAFLDQIEDVIDCVLVQPVACGDDKECLQNFLSFDILGARCYDPNEQQRVFAVVHTIGVGHFNRMVRELGRTLQFRLSGGGRFVHYSFGNLVVRTSVEEHQRTSQRKALVE